MLFSQLTSNALACKRFWLEGAELKHESAARLRSGTVEVFECATLRDFVTMREAVTSHQCFVYGVPANGKKVQRVSPKALATDESIARTRKAFTFPEGEPGLYMVDIDQHENARSASECDALLCRSFPAWSRCQRVWIASSSAYLRKTDGRELIGIGGWRAYAIIDDAARIPDLTLYLHQQLWAIGEGRIEVGKAGQRLDRTLIDKCVSTPERIDFVAAPELGEGLERFAPAPEFIGPEDAQLSTADLGEVEPYREWRKNCERFQNSWKFLEPEAKQKARAAARALKVSDKVMWDAVDGGVLKPEFKVNMGSGVVTVGELLDHCTEDYHGFQIPDPLEPDYDGGRTVAIIYLDHNPLIFSFARGGRTFRLSDKSRHINVQAENRHAALLETLRLMRERGEIFQSPEGDLLLRVAKGGQSVLVTAHWLADYLDRIAEWMEEVFDRRASPPAFRSISRDCPSCAHVHESGHDFHECGHC
jgi:hypothetical protein